MIVPHCEQSLRIDFVVGVDSVVRLKPQALRSTQIADYKIDCVKMLPLVIVVVRGVAQLTQMLAGQKNQRGSEKEKNRKRGARSTDLDVQGR